MKIHNQTQYCRLFFLLAIFQFCIACGVKGDPMPPLSPTVLGHGEPTFQKATEKIKIKKRGTGQNTDKKKNDSTKDAVGEDPELEELDFVEDVRK